MATERDDLEEAFEEFKLAEEAWEENRDRYVEDTRFARMGDQWPEYAVNARGRDRPCLTFNKQPAFIRQVVNDARQNKPAINIHPVDSGADIQTAQILTGIVRSIEVQSSADVAYDTAIDCAVTGGFGYYRINVDYAFDDTFDRDILIERIANPLLVTPDYDSAAADSSDWRQCFVSTWMPKGEFRAQYPDADEVDWASVSHDDPRASWVTEENIRVAEWWTRKAVAKTIILLSNGAVLTEDIFVRDRDILTAMGIRAQQTRTVRSWQVSQKLVSGAQVLETKPWAGKFIPIIPVYGDEVLDDEGKRHFFGLIHHAKDAQRAYNYWRTSAIEKVALETKAPWIGPKGAFKSDWDKWSSSNTTNWAFLEYDGGTPPERVPFAGVPSGDMAMAAQASDDMKAIVGIYDASLGARSNETSGRAIVARQRQGDVSTFHFIDNMSRSIRHGGRVIIDLIPHVFDRPRIARTLEEDGTPGSAPVNQEFNDQGISRIYDLRTGKYDVTVNAGPSFNTRREEAATQMTEIVRAFPQMAEIAGDLLVKNLDWPGADKLAERLKSVIPAAQGEQGGQNPQMAQMQQAMQEHFGQMQQQAQQMQADMARLQQENAALQLEVKNKQASTAIDAQKLQIEQFKAETDRLEAQIHLASEQAKLVQAQAPQPAAEPDQDESGNQNYTNLQGQIYQLQASIAAMGAALQANRPEPARTKTAKAVKQPDGTWLMQSIEEPVCQCDEGQIEVMDGGV